MSAALGLLRGSDVGASLEILFSLRDALFENLMTDGAYYELADKLGDPRFGFTGAFITDFLNVIASASTFVPIRGLDLGCRDDDDDRFVETAINGKADFLVSRDADLLDDDGIRHELNKRACALVPPDKFAETLRLIKKKEATPTE